MLGRDPRYSMQTVRQDSGAGVRRTGLIANIWVPAPPHRTARLHRPGAATAPRQSTAFTCTATGPDWKRPAGTYVVTESLTRYVAVFVDEPLVLLRQARCCEVSP